MGAIRDFQFPLVSKYSCVAQAQPSTVGSSDTEEKSPNRHPLLPLHGVITPPPVASAVPGPAIATSGLLASPDANTGVAAVPTLLSVNTQFKYTVSPLSVIPTASEGLKSSLLPLWNAQVVVTVLLLVSSFP